MRISLTYDYNNAMADLVGSEHGLTREMVEDLQGRATEAHESLLRLRKKNEVGFYDLADPEKSAARLEQCKRLGEEIAVEFENFVVLGIGGSALGPVCVHRALAHSYYNLLDTVERKGRPRIFVLDNADPELLGQLLDVVCPGRSCFNVVTKSGTTSETIAQFMAYYELVAAYVGEERAPRHFVITTSPQNGTTLAKRSEFYRNRKALGREYLEIPDNVGGRFSELSPVGLLPAAVAGFDIEAMIQGAHAVARQCETADLFQNPAYLNGAIHHLAHREKGKTISVLMPYATALREVADWYCQLWAESLGKTKGKPPDREFVGQTPIRALGTTDQHSQLQLYVQGPNDKIITFLVVEKFRNEFKTGGGPNEKLSTMKHLSGRDISELLHAELLATEFSLRNAERPSVRLTMDTINEANIGGLLFFYMVQTAFTGILYEIDPFDQPGVEESKDATHALTGRKTPGDPDTTRELKNMLKDLEAYKKSRSDRRIVAVGK